MVPLGPQERETGACRTRWTGVRSGEADDDVIVTELYHQYLILSFTLQMAMRL